PIVIPVSPQVGTNLNGPVNGNLFSNAQDSENAGTGPVDQLNANSSFTWLDNEGAQSNAFAVAAAGSLCDSGAGSLAVAGPIVATNQLDSGNASAGDVFQANVTRQFTGLNNEDAQSNSFAAAAALLVGGAGAGAVSGPIVVPVSGQVGTNVNGPVNVNGASNQ